MPEESKKPPEQSVETSPETAAQTSPETPRVPPEAMPPVAPIAVTPSAPPAVKDPETAVIENILAEGLEEAYQTMPPDLQIKFKAKGEETAGKIRALIATAKAKAKTILGLIKEWLKIIPGVNRFFLEQEAKIKTDKILARAEEQKKEV